MLAPSVTTIWLAIKAECRRRRGRSPISAAEIAPARAHGAGQCGHVIWPWVALALPWDPITIARPSGRQYDKCSHRRLTRHLSPRESPEKSGPLVYV
jgi:hypothetical protein